ncbi:amino acid permease C-terminal domain-containing protein [Pseudoroseomonas wenyumeiae]
MVPVLGIAFSLLLMVGLPFDTWLRLIIWMAMGCGVYFLYGRHHSRLRHGSGRGDARRPSGLPGAGLVLGGRLAGPFIGDQGLRLAHLVQLGLFGRPGI